MQQLTLSGHWPYPIRQQCPYHYLPFELPPGVRTLTVSYHTSLRSRSGSEHVDIGIFDPRGHEPGRAAGFRGWSGSARRSFFLSEADATPGYVAGPLPSGTWHLVLGSESRKPEDVTYVIDLAFHDEPRPPTPAQMPAFSAGVVRPEAGYYRGDLHCHTFHSDGTHSLEAVVRRAAARGLDFLSITNHNVLATTAELPAPFLDRFLLIGGQEVTTYRGHLNVWGIRDWIDFRAWTDAEMEAVVEAARARGALTSINHPREGGPAWEFPALPGIECVEVWNGPWVLNNTEAVALYDRLLCAGRRITAVGGSDIHVLSTREAPFPFALGNPTTHVFAEALSAPAVLQGLRRGRVCITADAGGQWAELRVAAGPDIAVMGEALPGRVPWRATVEARGLEGAVVTFVADGAVVRTLPVEAARDVALAAPRRYLRAEVLREPADAPEDRFGLALTNPVYRSDDTRAGRTGTDPVLG